MTRRQHAPNSGNADLKDQLATAYGMSVLDIAPLNGGLANETFFVRTTDGNYALTILGHRDVDRARIYAEYLLSLRGNGVRLAPLRRTTSGDLLVRLDTGPALLATFIEGGCRSRIAARHIPAIAASLAQVHSLTHVTTPLGPILRLSDGNVADFDTLRDREFGRWLRHWHDRVRQVFDGPGILVPTHGDPFPDNVVVRPNGSIVLIDWEDGGMDRPEVDVGMALLGLCGIRQFDIRRAALFMAAYRRHRGDVLDRELLLPATIYLGLLAAYNRYTRYAARLNSQADSRTYKDIPLLLRSLREQWKQLNRSR